MGLFSSLPQNDMAVSGRPPVPMPPAARQRPLTEEDYYNRMFEAQTPFVEAGMEQLPGLQEGATSAGYQDRLAEIMGHEGFQPLLGGQRRTLSANLAASGNRRSGFGAKAQASLPLELAQQLEGQATERQQNLFGLGQQALGEQDRALGNLLGYNIRQEQASDQRSAQRRQNNMNTLGTILSAAALFSDARLKTNLRRVGERDGINLYTWDWNETAKRELGLTGSGTGVVAQEVQRVKPSAVIERDGFLAVKMDEVFDHAG